MIKKTFHYTLKNGLSVIVHPDSKAEKVSAQLWYNVGSKHENDKSRGLAHLLEHMIFKGTKRLSESDINLITHKLSGYTNAFTSYDYTGYLFDFPKQNWLYALDLFADCMQNCIFSEDFLNSELKAVMQELRMYEDDYLTALTEQMISEIFKGHVYQHPIIGYRNDLYNVTQATLLSFYKKHYMPNNAVLVIVGDLDPEEVYQKTQEYFGSVAKKPLVLYKPQKNFQAQKKAASIQMYRSVNQPVLLFGFVIPGVSVGKHFYLAILQWLLAEGNGSRLYRELVEKHKVATEVETFFEGLFEKDLFFIRIYAKSSRDQAKIKKIIEDQLTLLKTKPFTVKEFARAKNQVSMQHYGLFEDTQELAYSIGQYFLATGDKDYVLNYIKNDLNDITQQVNDLLSYFTPEKMHQGAILEMNENQAKAWRQKQENEDKKAHDILSKRRRSSLVELGSYVDKVQEKAACIPKQYGYNSTKINNGLTVLTTYNDRVNTIDIMLNLKADHEYDPESQSGLCNFVYNMLSAGTKKYPGQKWIQILEQHGMSLEVFPGAVYLTVLKKDLNKGLEFLHEMLQFPIFEQTAIEKVRDQIIAEIIELWDTPTEFIKLLAKGDIYKGHPQGKSILGIIKDIKTITRSDIKKFWAKYVTPFSATIAIVGAVNKEEVYEAVDQTLGKWPLKAFDFIAYPVIPSAQKKVVDYEIDRDQIVLCFAAPSISRMNKDYDALVLFDQILTGGMLGSMSSRLFQLREQTGLFYTIGGSVVYNADKEPGMLMIKTIVSPDRAKKAQEMIKNCLIDTTKNLKNHEIQEAKNAVLNSMNELFSTNENSAQTMFFLDKYGLDSKYLKERAEKIKQISLKDVEDAAKRLLSTGNFLTIKVGRV